MKGKLYLDNLLYEWGGYHFGNRPITVFDTTLRDGLQSAQIKRLPKISEKIAFMTACYELGIDAIEIGFPIASSSHKQDVIALAKHAKNNKYPMLISCLSRTIASDVEAIIDVSQKAGTEVTVNLLVGSSKIRHFVESWTLEEIKKWIENCISMAHTNNLPVEFVTEDTTRSDAEILKFLYSIAINKGVKRIWIADTVGEATPAASKNITTFFKKRIIGRKKIGLDWHGHDDKGLGVASALAALEAGADRIQATALGIGERAGNTAMEQIIINLQLAHVGHYNLKKLSNYSRLASEMFGVPIRDNYPGIGALVHATAAGMHAAAITKARKLQRKDLEGVIYSPFHPEMFGRDIEVLIGPMSGSANVEWNLEKLGLKKNKTIIEKILTMAKSENRFISIEEVKKWFKK